jgi:hypothetical protein
MRRPTVLVPYPGPAAGGDEHDTSLYLRPESNGVLVESTILRELRRSERLRDLVRVAYLANIPGDIIAERGVVAAHHACRVRFALLGGSAFTPGMRRLFEAAFGVPFREAAVTGAFEALDLLGMAEEELFDVRVPPDQVAVILGQNVKHYRGYYIVNYDIPALRRKHNAGTDVFSMLLRSRADHADIQGLMGAVERALRQEGIVAEATPIGRVLHFSRGPFEQTLDGLGYLYGADGSPVPLGELSFARFLLGNGIDEARILDIVRNPLVRVRSPDGAIVEAEIFEYTRGDGYAAALAKLRTVIEPILPAPAREPRSYTPR